ncbi:MAG: 5'-deoxynucleotidase [Clostridiales bacterium]|nr:5'-deoxynucleotidase [Clostridiales bacterium]
MNGQYGFFAMLDRMQYINRWGLMRNSRTENIKEHSFDVAIIAHALTLIHNDIGEGIELDPYKVQSYAIYHDCTEIITGDLPTPIKYKNEIIKSAYKEVEQEAAETLSGLLPDFMQNEYLELLSPEQKTEEGVMIHRLVKAADRISAYLKCVSEENFGNKEFVSAKEEIGKSIKSIGLPEVDYFMEKFVPAYGMTLDEISK